MQIGQSNTLLTAGTSLGRLADRKMRLMLRGAILGRERKGS